MSSFILSCTPFSHNDVQILANLFEVSFYDYRQHASPSVTDFIQDIRTIAGLGLTATLTDAYLYPYYTHFQELIQGNQGDFRNDPGAPSLWGQRMAEMISMSLSSFRRLGYPGYYTEFFEAIEKNLKNLRIDLAHQTEEAQRLLAALPKPRRRGYVHHE